MLTVIQALDKLNQWSGWDRGMPSPAAVSRDGEGSPPGSGASGGFAVPQQHQFSEAHRSPCDAQSPAMWGSLRRGSLEPWLYISNQKCIAHLGAGSNISSTQPSTSQHGQALYPLDGFASLLRAWLQQEGDEPPPFPPEATPPNHFFSESGAFFLCLML